MFGNSIQQNTYVGLGSLVNDTNVSLFTYNSGAQIHTAQQAMSARQLLVGPSQKKVGVAQIQRASTSHPQMTISNFGTQNNGVSKLQRSNIVMTNKPSIVQSTSQFKPVVQMSLTQLPPNQYMRNNFPASLHQIPQNLKARSNVKMMQSIAPPKPQQIKVPESSSDKSQTDGHFFIRGEYAQSISEDMQTVNVKSVLQKGILGARMAKNTRLRSQGVKMLMSGYHDECDYPHYNSSYGGGYGGGMRRNRYYGGYGQGQYNGYGGGYNVNMGYPMMGGGGGYGYNGQSYGGYGGGGYNSYYGGGNYLGSSGYGGYNNYNMMGGGGGGYGPYSGSYSYGGGMGMGRRYSGYSNGY